jgi:hypothetical protein
VAAQLGEQGETLDGACEATVNALIHPRPGAMPMPADVDAEFDSDPN